MLEKIQLYQIYDAIIDRIPLTKEFLLSLGIDDEKIKLLTNQNILNQNEDNNYTLTSSSIKELYNYHGILQKRGLTERAIECIEACYELEPTNREISFGLIRMCIRIKKYNKVFEIFESLDDTQDPELQKDNNLYLYLLSIICNYPQKYRKRVLNLKYSDIAINEDSTRYQDIDSQNKIRIHLIHGRYSLVIKKYNDKISKIFPNVEERAFFQEILKKIKETEEVKYFSLVNFAEDKKYKEIVDYIENKRKVKKVSMFDAFVYYIAKKIIVINNSKKIPQVKVTNSSNLKEVLQGDNYPLLLTLIKNSELFNTKEKNILTILITDIIKLINTIKKERLEKKEQREKDINDIITLFFQNKTEEATNLLKSYLSSIKKEEYIFLILNLIKISSLNGNKDFSTITSLLNNLNSSSYKPNIEDYIEKFNESISKNKLEIAKIYLDIIKQLASVEILENNPSLKRRIPDMSSQLDKRIEDKGILFTYLKTLKDSDDPTMILTNISNNRKSRMTDMIKSIEGLNLLQLGNKDSKALLLRYLEEPSKPIDKKVMQEEITKSYLDGNYELSIDMNLKLIKSVYSIDPRLYAILGLSYLHTDNLELAIKFLSIAKGSYEASGRIDYRFDKLIEYLNEEPSEENTIKINNFIEKFNSSLQNCNIDKLKELAYYTKENNISLDEARIKYGLIEEQVLLIKLIYARDYYIDGLNSLGAKLLKEVERSKDKTPLVKSMLNEIIKSKNTYRNKPELHTRTKRKQKPDKI